VAELSRGKEMLKLMGLQREMSHSDLDSKRYQDGSFQGYGHTLDNVFLRLTYWNYWLGGKDSNICPLQETCKLFKELQSQGNGIYKYL
jgi:hypothetical protein